MVSRRFQFDTVFLVRAALDAPPGIAPYSCLRQVEAIAAMARTPVATTRGTTCLMLFFLGTNGVFYI